MDNVVSQLQLIHNYCIENESKEVFSINTDENCIVEETIVERLSENDQNNNSDEISSDGRNIYNAQNEYHMEPKEIGGNNCNIENNRYIESFEEKTVETYSPEIVENMFNVENVKEEYHVEISENMVVSNENNQYFNQPLNYQFQDINFIYTDNCLIHVCDICNKSFNKKSNLKRHYRSHTGENPHLCDVCNAKFPTMSRLKEHLHAHTGLRPHACNLCDKSFARLSNLTRHYRAHNGEKLYKCDKCDRRFIESTRLREHNLTHIGEKKFSCNVCDKRFLKKYNLKRHIQTHTGEHPHSCKICQRGFSKKLYLLQHLERHARNDKNVSHINQVIQESDIKLYDANLTIESDSLSRGIVEAAAEFENNYHNGGSLDKNIDSNSVNDVNLHSSNDQENKLFSCGQCSRHYINESSLLSHLQKHSGKDVLQCTECNAIFTHASRLKEHSVTHSGEKAFPCSVCGRRFGRNSNLLRHLQTHTGEKRYECNVCKKRFSNNSRLKEHLHSHTGVKPYQCNICNKLFRHKFGMQRHLLIHTGEKPHKCNICSKQFNRKGRLLVHHKTHKLGDPKFQIPNRIEPRLTKLIQSLGARLTPKRKHKKTKHLSIKNRSKKYLNNTTELGSLDEMEELTVEITMSDNCTDSPKQNNSPHSRRTCLKKKSPIISKTGFCVPLCKENSNKNFMKTCASKPEKSTDQASKSKSSVSSTLQNILNSKLGAVKQKSNVHIITKPIQETGSPTEEIILNVNSPIDSEEVEIDDLSVYKTQLVGNSLESFVLIKESLSDGTD